MEEIWKDVVGYEGLYKVSNIGNVRSSYRGGKTLTKQLTQYGYYMVDLVKNRNRKHFLVHRLVAITFIPNHLNYPFINHINAIKIDNAVHNLEWCTQMQNMRHAAMMGLTVNPPINIGEDNPISKLIKVDVLEIKRLISLPNGPSWSTVAKMFNVHKSTVADIVMGRTWRHV